MESEDQIQVQVQMGETRRVFFMPSPKTYNNLIEAIMQEIPKTRSLTFGLLYENDDKELVVMNDDPLCFRIAISGLKCIPGMDIHRLKVRICEGSSPSVKTKADQEMPDSCRGQQLSTLTSVPISERTSRRNTTRSCLVNDFMGCVDEDTDNEHDRIIMGLDNDNDDEDMNYITKNDTAKDSDEKTPLERYILKSEEKIDEQESVIQLLRVKSKTLKQN